MQDDWTVGSRLTLNVGLRYDVESGMFAERRGIGPWLPADRPIQKNRFGPRVGVAFNVDDVPAAVDAVKHYGVKPIAQPVTIDQGPNKGRKVVYLRDWDGITIELIEAK